MSVALIEIHCADVSSALASLSAAGLVLRKTGTDKDSIQSPVRPVLALPISSFIQLRRAQCA
ncbi:hypothetical protein [Phyllobacterium sp. P30BS-XVII]|uniref:hypothetical protein n=1 Tax=Phyllobacterium sp. P30BS-XVII TaxID=2587046 RepID=UPI0015FC4FA5|nr:hypothetical protein [Phyllobacterium sp. P30BS-XVII]MBA8903919.1 hypothetical protein [Phyllobacterium sp. P30BS-XVII]